MVGLARQVGWALDASFFAGPATVVWDRRAVFDRFDIEAGGLESGDGAFATTSGSFNADVDIFHAELDGFFGRLLGGHLAGKRSTFAASLESTGSGACPAECFTFGVSDGHGGVIKSRVHVGDSNRHIATNSAFGFLLLCHGMFIQSKVVFLT